jgi:hypothetical protein
MLNEQFATVFVQYNTKKKKLEEVHISPQM